MKLVAWMLLLSVSAFTHAQEDAQFQKVTEYFSQGKYNATVEELNTIEAQEKAKPTPNSAVLGLTAYWKGITHSRLRNFPEAIANFDKSLGYNYVPVDIHYEYGQSLFAAEKMTEARIQFTESVKKKHKRAVSLYYIGFISKEMGDKKKAFTFFKAIDKLDPEEAQEVQQASQMQIGDIYLEQLDNQADSFKAVEKYVIPQYQKALGLGPESALAPQIKEKIAALQRKYDLILFKLRNGRPTLVPPYFIRASQEIGYDTNVIFAPAETSVSEAKQGSGYSRTDFIGRYTFYLKDFMSLAPELRFNNTYYFRRIPEIHRNDNYLIAPALRSSYEHSFHNKPASLLLDYEFNQAQRDVNARQELEFSSRSHTVMLGERFNYFGFGETILRLRHRVFESYISTADAKSTSLVLEQIKSFRVNTLLFYLSYDRTRVESEVFDSDSLTLRSDLIMGRYRDWFTPSFGLALISTDPINDRENRGRELLINPNLRLSKTIGRSWRGNFRYDYQKNISKDEANFAFTKSTYGFELEYLF
ncbi:MAG TPA: hypothetical protein VNJ01_15250 [Bacteriovoracaceae bacterium]|nr:hypothetical protein [Bacteriovoracaceae bacterium]